MSDSAQEYKASLTKIIQKHIVILGPAITLAKVRHVPGITVTDDGTVTDITGDQKTITQQLRSQFNELSSMLVHKTFDNSQLTVDHKE